MIEAYPLQWPVGQPRTPAEKRKPSRFRATLSGSQRVSTYAAINRLKDQVRLFKAEDLVISTNMVTRRDGLPMSKAAEPDDPGVAVYLRLRGQVRCFQCDRWDRVGDNIAAIAAHIEALRDVERWGVGTFEQIFAGYKMLAAADAKKPWWVLLGFDRAPAFLSSVKTKFRERIAACHPDRGGNSNQAAELTAAMGEAEAYYAQLDNI